MDEIKRYTIGNVEFTMPKLSLGVTIEIQDRLELDTSEDPAQWTKAVWGLANRHPDWLFSRILSPSRPQTFFRDNIKCDDSVVQEMLKDFFLSYSPLEYAFRNLEAITKK